MPTSAHRAGRKDDVIQIRASAETKAILNRAAALGGQKLSEFMLGSARRQAEDTLLDQRIFFLKPDSYEEFIALLDGPDQSSPQLTELMQRKTPWQA